MPTFSLNTPLGYIGLLSFGLGVFLILAGFDILKVEKVSVKTGRATWLVGILFTIIGVFMFFTAEVSRPQGNAEPALEQTDSRAAGIGARVGEEGDGATEAVPSATVAPTIPPTAGQYERLAEAKTWPLITLDGFENNDSNWKLWNVDDDVKVETNDISEGVMHWGLNLRKADYFFLINSPLDPEADFYYAVRVRRLADPTLSGNEAAWGLFFRGDSFNGYGFRLNDNDNFSVMKRESSGWTSLIGWTSSTLVRKNQFNELAVIADGPKLTFFLNGVYVGEVTDTTYSTGKLSLIAGVNSVDVQLDLEYDDFEVRRKP